LQLIAVELRLTLHFDAALHTGITGMMGNENIFNK
jgi:hypothetical protein